MKSYSEYKPLNASKLKEGQPVKIRTITGEILDGVMSSNSDWLVGCPVVKVGDKRYAIGYHAEVIQAKKSPIRSGV